LKTIEKEVWKRSRKKIRSSVSGDTNSKFW